MSVVLPPQIRSQIDQCMIRDRHFLQRALNRARTSDQPLNQAVIDRFQKSLQQFAHRKAAVPKVQLAPALPVSLRGDEIGQAITDHQVVVVCGETGSGKSTQLPLICLNHGIGVSGMIGHTQPRRIAARSVSAQIARQIGTPLGKDVGFKIRFDDKTQDDTYVKLMTDGILLAETQSDRFLEGYQLIIIDEAHERSLNIDFLLGYLKGLLPKRSDLKMVITSATIDAQRFAQHFTIDVDNPVPIIEVAGRNYPVEIRYEPIEEDGEPDTNQAVIDSIERLVRQGPGDMLVFVPTENDIRMLSKQLRGRITSRSFNAEIVPLYARLSNEQQNLAFAPSRLRKIVLATNVAESSITVPGIRFVIDTGTARISRYAPRSKVQRLPIEPIAQASADQRAGRCGRVGPGICVRLYSHEDYLSRAKYTTPEIRRTNLASVILQTKSLKLGEIESFPFLDPPHPDAIRDGYKTLFEINAIDDQKNLTQLGRNLARMPVDPRIGRMIYKADEEGCLAEILIIASALEIQDPRDRPAEKQKMADQAHERFADEQSDFLSFLKIWDFTHQMREKLSRSQYRSMCQQNFLSQSRLQQWSDIHRQLKSMVTSAGLKISHRKNDYDSIHRALLTGLLSGVATLIDKFEYTGAGGLKFFLWPGSNLFQQKPKWIVVSEIVETNKRYGRNVAKIQPQWIEPIAQHLIKKHHSDPHWSDKNDACMAHQRVTLFGLTIVSNRRVPYATLDPEVSRQYLIEHGLVENRLRQPFEFQTENQLLVQSLNARAAKTRDRSWLVDEIITFEFYDRHLPQEAVDGRSLARLLKDQGKSLQQKLTMSEADLLPGKHQQFGEQAFPDQINLGELSLPIDYRFEPGSPADGLTLKVPQKAMGQLKSQQLGWLVPGMVETKIVALIRSLPKKKRRMLVPAPDTAKLLAEQIQFGVGDFETVVAEKLSEIAQERITVSDFELHKVDQTLKFNLQVFDDEGNLSVQGRDIDSIKAASVSADDTPQYVDDAQWNQQGLTSWNFDKIPDVLNVKQGSFVVPAYPALVDMDDSVAQRLFETRQRANFQSRAGIARLSKIMHAKQVKSQVNWLPDLDRDVLKFCGRFSTDAMKRDLGDLMIRLAMLENQKLPMDKQAFETLNENALEKISMATQQIARWFPKLANAYHQAQLAIEATPKSVFGESLSDVKRQITEMFSGNWAFHTPWKWLEQFPRYLSAIELRLSKLNKGNLALDIEMARDIEQFLQRYLQQLVHSPESIGNPELVDYRWMIEEFRVSQFAQTIGTSVKISPQRLDKQWKKFAEGH
jgi:ATP-dependent helicase HrpA